MLNKKNTLQDALLDILFTHSHDIIVVMNDKQEIIELNGEAEDYFQCTKNAALHQDYTQFCKQHHKDEIIHLAQLQNRQTSFYDQASQREWSKQTIPGKSAFFLIVGKRIQSQLFHDQLNQLKQAEHDHKTISQYLQDIISVVPGSIYWKDEHGVYLGCNDYMVQTAGFSSKQDIIGKSDFELWPTQAAQFQETDQNVMRLGQAIRIEEEVLLPNGKKRLFIVDKMPLRDSNGNIHGIIGNSLEITELKETQLALEAANRAKTEFIANMGHDIRTPLTGVIGLSEALESELNNPKQKQFASTIRESGNQLLNLLNGILDVISTDHINEQDIHLESFNLQECMQSIADLGRSSTYKKGIDLLVHIDEKIPHYIVSDRTKLHRVLLNLLGNAIKFTKKGEIELAVTPVVQQHEQLIIQFQVRDTGIGIPNDQQALVFERFFRGNPSYEGIYQGNGIGLHIAQSYVKLLGGEIKLQSQEGVGTTFYFDLPCQIGQKQPQPISSLNSAPVINQDILSEDLSHPSVLLVEDNAIALMVIENLLDHANLRYISATDGESAFMLAKIHDFDLIITDLGLPGMSGIELTKQIRDWERIHHKKPVPIIGLSAHTNEDVLSECVPSGMNDRFSKPITKNLIQTLKNTYILSQNSTQNTHLSSLSSTIKKLGQDLPANEKQLFELDAFQLFDHKLALCAMNNNAALLPEILSDFIEHDLPESLNVLNKAYKQQDWDQIEKRVHYMKSTLNFTGTPRMKHACQFLERYKKAGHSALLHELYHQLIDISELTQKAIRAWLKTL